MSVENTILKSIASSYYSILFLAICLSFSANLSATVLDPDTFEKEGNLEKPKESEEDIWSFSTAFGASVYTGNEEFSLASFEGKAEAAYTGHTLVINPKAEYKQSDEEKTRKVEISLSDVLGLDVLAGMNDQWGATIDFKYLKDDANGIANKTESLVGIGYDFWGSYRKSPESLKLNFALGYRDQKNTDDTNNHFAFANTKLSYDKKLSKTLKIGAEAAHLANVNNFGEDYEAIAKAFLENLINATSSIILKQESVYDNIPVEGKKKYSSISKVEYKFSF